MVPFARGLSGTINARHPAPTSCRWITVTARIHARRLLIKGLDHVDSCGRESDTPSAALEAAVSILRTEVTHACARAECLRELTRGAKLGRQHAPVRTAAKAWRCVPLFTELGTGVDRAWRARWVRREARIRRSIGSPTPIADAQTGDRGRSPKGRVGRRGRTTSPRGKPTFLSGRFELDARGPQRLEGLRGDRGLRARRAWHQGHQRPGDDGDGGCSAPSCRTVALSTPRRVILDTPHAPWS